MLANPLLSRERSMDSLDGSQKGRLDKSKSSIEVGEQVRDYRLGTVIGRGTYSIVRIAKSREGKKVAVKTYMKAVLNADRQVNLDNEVRILSALDHPSILSFLQCIETEEAYHLVT